MTSTQCLVGRLVEIQFSDVRNVADVLAARHAVAELVERFGDTRIVLACDYRGINILDKAAAHEFLENFKFGDSSRVERSGLLIDPERATFMMQVERLIREANSTVRKTFREAAELEAWLSGVLTAEEQHRLHAFLASSRPPRRII